MNLPNIDHKDIQAIVRGFDKRWPRGRFYYCRYESSAAGHRLLQWIIKHNDGFLTSYFDLDQNPEVCVNAAFTYWGLYTLGLAPEVLQSFPGDFRQGMVKRAKLNRDVEGSDPKNWDEMWQSGRKVHLWIGVYASTDTQLDQWGQALQEMMDRTTAQFAEKESASYSVEYTPSAEPFSSMYMREVKRTDIHSMDEATPPPPISIVGTQSVRRFWSSDDVPMHIDDASTPPKGSVVLEHFGFRDGVSQPFIKGLEQDKNKTIHNVSGGGKLTENGVWKALATGEFILGYPDEMGEIPIAPVPSTLSKNGTFMVQRKLYQDVDAFREYLTDQAKHRVTLDGKPLTADYLAAKMIGRKRDGTSFYDTDSLNDFRFKDDPDGNRCPLGSHVRRSNPRDSLCFDSEVAHKQGSVLVNRHRVLRRAITYGDPVPTGVPQLDVNKDGQGLMFITLQSSISGQFEFVQQQWINQGNDLNQGNDRDPMVGHQDGKGKVSIPGDGVNPTVICSELPRFVETRGGNYFFLPGVCAFNLLADSKYN